MGTARATHTAATMAAMQRKKIVKEGGAAPSDFEETVAQALFDLEATNAELKADLKDLYINGASEVNVSSNRRAIVIKVPFRLLKQFNRVQQRLVRPTKSLKDQRPRSRTLTAVHDALLEDLVYPVEIVGKRLRYKLDGSKLLKVFLDPKDRNTSEYKLETFAGVYSKMTGKAVTFEYGN